MADKYVGVMKRSRDMAHRGTDCADALKRKDRNPFLRAQVHGQRRTERQQATQAAYNEAADETVSCEAVTARLRYQDSLMVEDGCIQSPTGALVYCMAD